MVGTFLPFPAQLVNRLRRIPVVINPWVPLLMLPVVIVGVKRECMNACFHLFGVIGFVSCVIIDGSHSSPYLEML